MSSQFNRQEFAVTTQQTKQIATIKWLLHKAYNDDIPSELKDPFYVDKMHRSTEKVSERNPDVCLKPVLANLLAKAKVYCLALENLYLDPNCQNLDHRGIMQVLTKKGVLLSDSLLTEADLLQSSPLKLEAHLCITKAIMMLYAKETITFDRVSAAIKKLCLSQQQGLLNHSKDNVELQQLNSASNCDQLLLLWITKTVLALNVKIRIETQNDDDFYFKNLPIKELFDLRDGVALCAVVSYYCPRFLQWHKIRISESIPKEDYNFNMGMLYNCCEHSLLNPVFHMSPLDMFQPDMSARINIIALLVDLFTILDEQRYEIPSEIPSEPCLAPAEIELEEKWRVFFTKEVVMQPPYLSRYAKKFAEEDISMDRFFRLDESMLKELGVLKMGHRIAILMFIENKVSPSSTQSKNIIDSIASLKLHIDKRSEELHKRGEEQQKEITQLNVKVHELGLRIALINIGEAAAEMLGERDKLKRPISPGSELSDEESAGNEDDVSACIESEQLINDQSESPVCYSSSLKRIKLKPVSADQRPIFERLRKLRDQECHRVKEHRDKPGKETSLR